VNGYGPVGVLHALKAILAWSVRIEPGDSDQVVAGIPVGILALALDVVEFTGKDYPVLWVFSKTSG
jgi:hypothetical protein